MFGLRIPQNFDSPYRASGIADFWRRWHISLSSWLRDYLYIPLGGNRGGSLRTTVNLLVTMLLGGLWHGANWTYVVWGAYHGLLLCLDRSGRSIFERLPGNALKRAVTSALVVVGWVIFRANNLTGAVYWLRKMFLLEGGGEGAPAVLWMWLIACLVAVNATRDTWHYRFAPRPRMSWALALLLFVAYLFINGHETVFLYYQF
ncbi:MAG: MBOAT family O-acyltransferase [Candidatus Solibacter sp.]